MNHFLRISIRYKLLLGFIALTLLIIPVSIYTIRANNEIKNNLIMLADVFYPRLQALLEMKMTALRVTSFINNFNKEIESTPINENTPTKLGATKDKLLAYLGDIDDWQKKYAENSFGSEQGALNLQKLSELHDKVILMALASFATHEKNANRATQNKYQEELSQAQQNLDDFISSAVTLETNSLAQKKESILSMTKKVMWITFLINLLAIITAILISLILSTLISSPIIRLKNFASKVTQQNLEQRIDINSKDEIGELATSINTMLENLLQTKMHLMDASRDAGMAEVATSILHNIGNVLNSVNISANILYDLVEHSKSADLHKVNMILLDHQNVLGAFFSNDTKGKHVLPYLQSLATQLSEEQSIVKKELRGLINNLQHINNIVAMQQSYAKTIGVIELISIPELIKTICIMNKNIIVQSSVTIEYDFIELLPVKSIKAKIQQILINLIVNAIDAVEENNPDNKIIKIKLRQTKETVEIAIIDNGIGIDPENLSRIFTFGFTTKEKGHGYGMHNSALQAKELGGSLSIHSEGTGKGVTVILQLPYTTETTQTR